MNEEAEEHLYKTIEELKTTAGYLLVLSHIAHKRNPEAQRVKNLIKESRLKVNASIEEIESVINEIKENTYE